MNLSTLSTNSVKCDGDHGMPRCNAETCWQDDPDAGALPCPHCGAKTYDRNMYGLIFDCGSTLYNPAVAKSHVSDLCRMREAHNKTMERLAEAEALIRRRHDGWKKAQAENQKLRELLENILDAVPAMYREQYEQLTK